MIEELRTLIEVSRSGTFAAAGLRLGLTQSAVSGQMKRLEANLGFRLFDRSGRSALLNAAGIRTVNRAREVTAMFDALRQAASDEPAEMSIRIGSIESVQSTLLARALKVLLCRFPLLKVHITPGLSIHLLDQVDAGELDLAISVRPPFGMPAELSWVTLFKEPYMLIVPAALTGEDWSQLIQTQPFLRYDRTSFGGRQVDRFLRQQRLEIRDTIELDVVDAIIKMVGQELGVALVPLAYGHPPLPAGVRFVSLGEQTFHREIGVIQHQDKLKKPEVSCLVDSLLGVANR